MSSQHKINVFYEKKSKIDPWHSCVKGKKLKRHCQILELQVGNHSPFLKHTKFRHMLEKFSKSNSYKKRYIKKYQLTRNTKEFQYILVFHI